MLIQAPLYGATEPPQWNRGIDSTWDLPILDANYSNDSATVMVSDGVLVIV